MTTPADPKRKIKPIPMPPGHYSAVECAYYLAQAMKSRGRADVAQQLMKQEKKAPQPSKRKKRVEIATRYGTRVKGGVGYIEGEVLEKAMRDNNK